MITGPGMARLRGASGAILIQAAGILLLFTAVSAMVVDYGIQLLGRNQAQNVVDSAALAAATALAYDGYTVDPNNRVRVVDTARTVAAQNLVAGKAPAVDVAAGPLCQRTLDDPNKWVEAHACVEVTAYRDADHGNAINTLFGRVFNVNTSDINAHATAQAKVANISRCLRPIAIPDKWQENPASPSSGYDLWDPAHPSAMLSLATRDAYTPPQMLAAGNGLTLSADFGRKVTLSEGVVTTPIATIKAWQYLPIEIPGSQWGGGAAAVRANTNSCADAPVSFDDVVDLVPGGVHSNALSIADGARDLIAKDPDAIWNEATHRVENSCATLLVGRCGAMSPRIIALAVYDLNQMANDSEAGSLTALSINNMVGFFIDSVSGTDITGYITTHPGLRDLNSKMLIDDSSFLRAPMLAQ